MTNSDAPRFQILALDGGGFRGLAQAKFLAKVEQATGKKTAECFDLITGTSTGAILTLAVSLGIPAQSIVKFYVEDGKQIFPCNGLTRWWRKKKQWILSAHSSRNLEAALRKCLKREKFPEEEPLLGDSVTRLVVPAYYMTQRKPYYFKTDHRLDYTNDYSRPMWEVAMATTAAPTYFPYFKSSRREHFCDGGLFANNPSMVGILEAEHILKVTRPRITVLNLGNGELNASLRSPSIFRNCGKLGWAPDIADYLMDTNAYGVPKMSELIIGDRYVRISPAVCNTTFPLDLYDPDALEAAGETLFRDHFKTVGHFFNHTALPYAKEHHKTYKQ